MVQGAGVEAVNNGAMASIPGHPFWMEAARLLQQRVHVFDFGPVFQTGPKVIADALDHAAGTHLEAMQVNCRQDVVFEGLTSMTSHMFTRESHDKNALVLN